MLYLYNFVKWMIVFIIFLTNFYDLFRNMQFYYKNYSHHNISSLLWNRVPISNGAPSYLSSFLLTFWCLRIHLDHWILSGGRSYCNGTNDMDLLNKIQRSFKDGSHWIHNIKFKIKQCKYNNSHIRKILI